MVKMIGREEQMANTNKTAVSQRGQICRYQERLADKKASRDTCQQTGKGEGKVARKHADKQRRMQAVGVAGRKVRKQVCRQAGR